MRIAVCDDSAIDRGIISEMLNLCFEQCPIKPELVPYGSGVSLVCDIQEGAWYDIVFLDIYMSDHLGIDIAHRLRAEGYTGEIVFLTASPDFAVDSYDVMAAGYILKPISYDKLQRVVVRLTKELSEKTYPVRIRTHVERVPISSITYVESSNNKCVIHTASRDYSLYKKLDEIEEDLDDERFLRCHQSYLVNMDYVAGIDKNFTLTSGETVFVRQKSLKAMREAYESYLTRRDNAETE